MPVFYFFAVLVLLQSVVSLRGGLRYLRFVRRELSAVPPPFTPFASIVVPCRGAEHGLRENLSALFTQDYPTYELVFVSDRADDPALSIAEEVRRSFDGVSVARARVVVAGRAHDSGQKVHNLRAAVRQLDPACEVIVFVDTDARTRADWLRQLVAPLADERIGASTGYRWLVPARGGLWSHLRSAWNASIASALGEDGATNFCWGGSTAIRRDTFERLGVAGKWRGTLSDDFALTRVLHDARLPVRFVPRCLTASPEDCTFAGLVEFTTRQIKITRVYAPRLWKLVLFSNLLFTLVFFGGVGVVSARAAVGLRVMWPLALLCVIYALGTAKAFLRLTAVGLVFEGHDAHARAAWWAHLLLWPLTSALYLYNALAAALSCRITWRGITYELISPTETAIISCDPEEEEEAEDGAAAGAKAHDE